MSRRAYCHSMQVNETILLFITTGVTAAATFFCLIALATPRWSLYTGLFCTFCQKAPAALSIISFILLILTIVALILLILKVLPKSIRIIILLFLFIATIFTLSTFASYVDAGTGYSFKLMVFSHFLCYIASLLATFWLGGSYAATVVSPN